MNLPFGGGNVKNLAHFKRRITDFEIDCFKNMESRNDRWFSEKSRLGKKPENWDLVDVNYIFMFIRRVEDMNPETYDRVLSTIRNWQPMDSRWQALAVRLLKLNGENVGDFDLAQDIIKNDL